MARLCPLSPTHCTTLLSHPCCPWPPCPLSCQPPSPIPSQAPSCVPLMPLLCPHIPRCPLCPPHPFHPHSCVPTSPPMFPTHSCTPPSPFHPHSHVPPSPPAHPTSPPSPLPCPPIPSRSPPSPPVPPTSLVFQRSCSLGRTGHLGKHSTSFRGRNTFRWLLSVQGGTGLHVPSVSPPRTPTPPRRVPLPLPETSGGSLLLISGRVRGPQGSPRGAQQGLQPAGTPRNGDGVGNSGVTSGGHGTRDPGTILSTFPHCSQCLCPIGLPSCPTTPHTPALQFPIPAL